MALTFESINCSRCGGSGKHSWCQQYGDTCFKCHGQGETLTKRGRAAQVHLNSLRTVRADSVMIGQLIQCETMTVRYFAAVTAIKPVDCYGEAEVNAAHINLKTDHPTQGGFGRITARDNMIRVAFSKDEKREQVKLALAYQETLTKAGTPRKRAA